MAVVGDFSMTGLAGQRKWSSEEETVFSKTSTLVCPLSKNTEEEALTSTFEHNAAKVSLGCVPQESKEAETYWVGGGDTIVYGKYFSGSTNNQFGRIESRFNESGRRVGEKRCKMAIVSQA